MKLAQVVPSLELQYGGPSRSVYAVSAALARAGHETELFATHPTDTETRTEGALRVRIFKRGSPHRICPSAGLRTALRGTSVDVIQHHALWLRTLHYAHQSAKATGAKLVVSPRGMMSGWAWRHNDWKKKIARALIHPGALAAVDGWHATSEEEATDIQARGFKQPICVAPNGVDAPNFSEAAAAGAHWNSVCPDVGKKPVALFYSRFHRKKRVIELIDLWLEHGPRDWLLLLVGIPEEYSPEELNRYVLRASGTGRVQAFSGVDRPVPYPVASLLLLPSHSENFGLAVAESMAHGVPTLVTDTTPWRALNSTRLGWCVPWEDFPAALKAATAEGPRALRERGALAREWVLREYAWDKSAQILAEFYARLKGGTA